MSPVRVLLPVVAMLGFLPLFAVDIGPVKGDATPAAIPRGTVDTNFMVRSGGFILAPAQGPSIVVLNMQTAVPASVVDQAVKRIQLLCRLPLTLRSVADNKNKVRDLLRKELAEGTNRVTAVVLLGAFGDEPSLLVAPDDRWALINTDTLTVGAQTDVLMDRVAKETWRAVALATGGAGSLSTKCVLGPVLDVRGLDDLGHAPGGDAILRIQGAAKRLGARPVKLTTYRKAVEEGWAPSPTNDIQRTIWNELKKK